MKSFPFHRKSFAQNLFLPLAVAAYPVLFLYGQNAKIINLTDIILPLGLPVLVAGIGFGLFYLFQRRQATASLSMAAFMVFYYLYGYIYNRLVNLDLFPVYHFILLPIIVTLGIYAGYFISLVKGVAVVSIQKVLVFVSVALVVINLVVTIPVEVQKIIPRQAPVLPTKTVIDLNKKYPDIYFIIFDEYVGFDAMRNYWHNDAVDQFAAFLTQNHFFVAENSLSVTHNTLSEMASRLNLHQYKEDTDSTIMLAALRNNIVMQILKSYGYTTVVINMAFQGIIADEDVSFKSGEVEGLGSDEFKRTFINSTMADAFGNLLQNNDQVAVKQRDLLLYALGKTTDLADVHSPKFVYTHLLLPHEPFIFDANGNLLPQQDFYDWHYYLGQYQYTTKLAEKLATKLLAQADPDNPPVIIIQSDHGARNLQSRTDGDIVINGVLENYPTEDYNMVLNSLYLPGYDTSQLPNNLAPIDTFELVLNHYLNAGVSVDPSCPCDH